MRDLLKSYWYYWYSGNKPVAVVSMALTTVLVGFGALLIAGLSIWGVVIAVLMDTVGVWVALIYVGILRQYLPTLWVTNVDVFLLYELVLPVAVALVVGRLVTFAVARGFGRYPSLAGWLSRGSMVALGTVLMGGLVYVYYPTQAEVEPVRASLIDFGAIKAQSTQAVTKVGEVAAGAVRSVEETGASVAMSVSDTAAGTKRTISAACRSIAESLGKKPEDYCGKAEAALKADESQSTD